MTDDQTDEVLEQETQHDVVDLDTLSDTLTSEQIAIIFGPPTSAEMKKPDISNLPDAIVAGLPIFVKGDKIVIERRAVVLQGCPYLDTKTYKVLTVDVLGGKIELYDESLNQFAMDDWKKGLAIGQVYKFTKGAVVTSKRKRGRPRKNPLVEAPVVPVVELGSDGRPAKKKRGRPAGVKNRSKDVIAAERIEHKKTKAAKKAAKKK